MAASCFIVGVAGVVGLGLVSCASAPHPPLAPVALPAGVGEAKSTVLIGDLHGTREIPAFVGRLVSTLSAHQPVALALEIPGEVATPLEAFLASDGGHAARDALVHAPWWQEAYQDGRRSVAMLELIDTARRLRAAGAKLTVACIDAPAGDPPDGRRRDAAMAEHVIAVRAAQPEAVLVVYAGNFHTRKAPPPGMPDYETMAMKMAKGGLSSVSLNARWADGNAWICFNDVAGECGPKPMRGKPDEPGVHVERSSDGAYDGCVGIGPITASPPAKTP